MFKAAWTLTQVLSADLNRKLKWTAVFGQTLNVYNWQELITFDVKWISFWIVMTFKRRILSVIFSSKIGRYFNRRRNRTWDASLKAISLPGSQSYSLVFTNLWKFITLNVSVSSNTELYNKHCRQIFVLNKPHSLVFSLILFVKMSFE